jgi:preprotein translocase subunit SecD
MKALKYFVTGIMLIAFIPFCQARIPAKNKQVITLQSVPGNAPADLLAGSKEILVRRLESLGIRDVQVTQVNAKSELVVTVVDTISPGALSEILLIRGDVCFKADSVLVLNRDNLSEVHANLDNPALPELCISFKEKDWKVWENMTIRNLNKPVALIVDDKVYASPQIMEPISHGKISLTGNGLSKAEVLKLVAIISNGPVPLKFTVVMTN